MARPKGSKNKPRIVSTSGEGLINLGGGVPATPETPVEDAPVADTKRVALGRVNIEKLFRASAGQMTVHESQNGNIVFKGRCVDENGITYMTTMLMPLNPTTGKAMKASEVDISSLIG